MAQFTPDYEHLYMQEEFSDVKLVIKDESETTAAGQKRRRKSTARTIPGHCLLLLGHSGYCKAKLENWKNEQGSSTRSAKGAKQPLEIVMPVPAGQEELAELLIKGMYQKQPSIAQDLNHEQLLQLMLLADRFEVPKVQAAVAAAFSAVQPQQLEWQTALQLLDLPPSCAQQAEFKAVQQLAVQRLQQQLGDLEEVWADEQLQQQLLGLSFNALLQLLQHADTRVATENTVVYTITEWYEARAEDDQSIQQLKQLMRLVRLQHCTFYYAGTVMMQSILANTHCPALKKYPAWGAEQRPASAKQPVIEWQLPLSLVQAAVEKHLSSSSDRTTIGASSTHIVQGQPAYIDAVIDSSSSNSGSSSDSGSGSGSGKELDIAAFLQLQDLPTNAVRKVSARLAILKPKLADGAAGRGRQVAGPEIHSFELHDTFMSKEFGQGGELVKLGAVASWEAAEAALRQKRLVHAGGPGDAAAAGPHLLVRVELLELL
uniref:BACK domain-containing protein n=1 Tax=Tetradesmus obliquus TaxID=3088 RepID=A0A383W349_TETOB|eukprot:jgi/Sobl393_1/8760/SZX71454.1